VHLLVIPFRHAADYFSLTVDEKHAVLTLIDECKEVLLREYT
jgi:diadenosine tetraphosphate (Ap4A) HIT family hydrolase